MQGLPNRMGLGMRPQGFGMGQGPSISALAQQQQQMANQQQFVPATPQVQKPQHTLFVGSISGGITDGFLNELLSVSGRSHSIVNDASLIIHLCDNRLVEWSKLLSE